MTTLNEAENIILEHFIDGWNAISINGESFTDRFDLGNDGFNPKDPDQSGPLPADNKIRPWARININYAANPLVGFGKSRLYRRSGTIVVQTYVPQNRATAQANILAQAVMDIFEGKKIRGISFSDVVPTRIGETPDGFQTNITLVFDWFESRV